MLLVLWKKWLSSSSQSVESPEELKSPEEWVNQIQNGEPELRNELIRQYRPFILKSTSRFYRRYIDPQLDDAYSVALAAFDEAITGYSPQGGRLFLGFAETVINRRLIDHLRQESRQVTSIPYSTFESEAEDGESTINRVEIDQAMEAYTVEKSSNERRIEIETLSGEMAMYGITFGDLVDHSPKHQDSRDMLLRIGRLLANEDRLYESLREKRQLPIKELCQLEALSRKTVERHRKYLIAVALIAKGTYPFLQEYIGLDRQGEGEKS